jgi:branched-chain amino acid transport system permease protein
VKLSLDRASLELDDAQREMIRKAGIPTLIAAVIVVAIAMSPINIVSVLVNGLQIGSVYALVALGLALVYRATRVLNFAQGELGTVPAFAVFMILVGFDRSKEIDVTAVGLWPMLGASLVAVVIGAGLAIAINLFIVRRLADASAVTSLVATLGVALFFTAAELIFFQAKARKFPRFVSGAPSGREVGPLCLSTADDAGACLGSEGSFAIGGAVISWHMIIVVLVLAGVAAGLAIFFKTPPGVALLATAQEPFAAELHGVSVKAMSAIAWGAAGAFAALGGILGAGVDEFIAPGLMTGAYLIPAIVAAVLGGITSMPGAVFGGLLLGIAVTLSNTAVLAYGLSDVLPGPPQLATFAVLLIVLLFRPRGLFGKEA